MAFQIPLFGCRPKNKVATPLGITHWTPKRAKSYSTTLANEQWSTISSSLLHRLQKLTEIKLFFPQIIHYLDFPQWHNLSEESNACPLHGLTWKLSKRSKTDERGSNSQSCTRCIKFNTLLIESLRSSIWSATGASLSLVITHPPKIYFWWHPLPQWDINQPYVLIYRGSLFLGVDS